MVGNKAAHESAHGNGIFLLSPEILVLEERVKLRRNGHLARLPTLFGARQERTSVEFHEKEGELNVRDMPRYQRPRSAGIDFQQSL